MKNANLGYPTAIEEDDGRIFVAYYGEDREGVTYVMGSHFFSALRSSDILL